MWRNYFPFQLKQTILELDGSASLTMEVDMTIDTCDLRSGSKIVGWLLGRTCTLGTFDNAMEAN